MHYHHFLLRQLANELSRKIVGYQITACFSQAKDELVLELKKEQSKFYIHGITSPQFTALHFPADFGRARKNSVDLFESVIGLCVQSVYCFSNERSIALELNQDRAMVFKLFGSRSNVILFKQQQPKEIFRNNMADDLDLRLDSLHRELDTSRARFNTLGGNLKQFMPTLGPQVRSYLDTQGYQEADLDRKWGFLQEVMGQLKDGSIYLQWYRNLPQLYLFHPSDPFYHGVEAIEAMNEFYHQYIKAFALEREKMDLGRILDRNLKQAKAHLNKTEQRLDQLSTSISYQLQADLIMANMHDIPEGASEATLPHFETGEPVKIKLKPALTPQMNAQHYYRKSKNQGKEVQKLKSVRKSRIKQLKELQQYKEFLSHCGSIKELRNYVRDHQLTRKPAKTSPKELFKTYSAQGFSILVGRNARNNDLLTLKYAHKEDLWLHAKDVKGSHVVIKHLAGQQFPKAVIERAAQLAAFYSQRSTESWAPVSYTPKKFVRKPKGALPGQVVVEKEQVLIVEPKP